MRGSNRCTSGQVIFICPDGTCICSSKCLTCAGYHRSDFLTYAPSQGLPYALAWVIPQSADNPFVPCGTAHNSANRLQWANALLEGCHGNLHIASGPHSSFCPRKELCNVLLSLRINRSGHLWVCRVALSINSAVRILWQDCHSACAQCFGQNSSESQFSAAMIHGQDSIIKWSMKPVLHRHSPFPCMSLQDTWKTDGTCAPCMNRIVPGFACLPMQISDCVDTTLREYRRYSNSICFFHLENAFVQRHHHNSTMAAFHLWLLSYVQHFSRQVNSRMMPMLMHCVEGIISCHPEHSLAEGKTCMSKVASKEYRRSNDKSACFWICPLNALAPKWVHLGMRFMVFAIRNQALMLILRWMCSKGILEAIVKGYYCFENCAIFLLIRLSCTWLKKTKN